MFVSCVGYTRLDRNNLYKIRPYALHILQGKDKAPYFVGEDAMTANEIHIFVTKTLLHIHE